MVSSDLQFQVLGPGCIRRTWFGEILDPKCILEPGLSLVQYGSAKMEWDLDPCLLYTCLCKRFFFVFLCFFLYGCAGCGICYLNAGIDCDKLVLHYETYKLIPTDKKL